MMTRRVSLSLPLLSLPLLLTACGGRERRTSFPPLHYDYLTPLQLNVAAVRVEQRYAVSGTPPDVSRFAPVPPVEALRAMAADRLQALGSTGEAVFVIQDASLVRRGDTISGTMSVALNIYPANPSGPPAGYAQASVAATYTGDLDDLRGRLYDLTKDMMDRMNVEFEYQVRRSLREWLLPPGAALAPVQQQSLTPGQDQAPPPTPAPSPDTAPSYAPSPYSPAPPPQPVAPSSRLPTQTLPAPTPMPTAP
jgi:hypothetical protein